MIMMITTDGQLSTTTTMKHRRSNHQTINNTNTNHHNYTRYYHYRCLLLTIGIFSIISLIFYLKFDNWTEVFANLNIINGRRYHRTHRTLAKLPAAPMARSIIKCRTFDRLISDNGLPFDFDRHHHLSMNLTKFRHKLCRIIDGDSITEDNQNDSNNNLKNQNNNNQQSLQIFILIIICVILYLAYTIDCYHCSTRLILINGKRIHHVMDYLKQLKQAKPIIWWNAASYHYVRYFYAHHHDQHQQNQNRSIRNYGMINEVLGSHNDNSNDRINQQNQHRRRCIGRRRIDTRYSYERFDYDNRFTVVDISDRLPMDIDRSPITIIHFFKGFIFADEPSALEFDRQRSKFFHQNFKYDDYVEIREGIDFDGADFIDTIITLSVDGARAKHNWHWYCQPTIFWLFSFILLSWPFRIILEYNTSHVDFKVVKLFTLLNTPTINGNAEQSLARGQNYHHRSQTSLMINDLSNYLIAPSYSETLLTCSNSFQQFNANTAFDDDPDNDDGQSAVINELPSYSDVIGDDDNQSNNLKTIRRSITIDYFTNDNRNLWDYFRRKLSLATQDNQSPYKSLQNVVFNV